jgi:hypothetical protein
MRTLLVLMSICCVAMGTWSVYVQPFRDQAASLAKVAELGGTTTSVSANGPDWQRRLVETILGKDQFINVQTADLRNCRVNAADVETLAGLRYLKSFLLDRAEVNDSNVAVLKVMSPLEELSLTYTQVSDDGLRQLTQLANLHTLHLTGAPITDASVEELSAMLSLRELYIRWTKISPDGVARLRQALPACAIHHHVLRQSPPATANSDADEPLL